MACSDVSSDIADISDEIDRQIEVYLSNMTDKQFDDFINSSQLQPAHATAPDPAPPSSAIVSTARFATLKDDEAVLAAQLSEALNGHTVFGISGVRAEKKATASIHHPHSFALMRAVWTDGYVNLY